MRYIPTLIDFPDGALYVPVLTTIKLQKKGGFSYL